MIDSVHVALVGMLAVVATIFSILKSKKKTAHKKRAPKNIAAQAALDDVQESLKEELDRIKAATDGDSPADDLADLGNARKRR